MIDTEELVAVTRLLVDIPSAPGDERRLAEAIADAVAERWPAMRCELDVFDGSRANVIVEAGTGTGPDLGLYAHLDTTLTGDPRRDVALTGLADATGGLDILGVGGSELAGPGLAVAKGPMAAGLLAMAAASATLTASATPHRLRFLVAAGGTHRMPSVDDGASHRFGVGVRRALDGGFRPDAVVNLKGGAPAPLHEEPGAAFIGVQIRGPWTIALLRSDGAGMAAALGPLVAAVERWRRHLVAQPVEGSAAGREAALGAVTMGSLDKPDILPALLTARLYVVLAPGDDPEQLAAHLGDEVAADLRGAGLDSLTVTCTVDAYDLSARTDPSATIVAVARRAWTDRFGPISDVERWRGSTDGVVFRQHGIPTVRVGPRIDRDPDDPRRDRVELAQLQAFAELYSDVMTGWVEAGGEAAAPSR